MSKNSSKLLIKTTISFAAVVILILLTFYWSILSGGVKVSLSQLFRGLFVEYDRDVAIIYDLRFPRVFVALIGGAVMAVSGVLMQAVMKNPLAEPGIIGVSSGAAFASALLVAFVPALSFLTPLASFTGGMTAFCLVFMLSWNKGLSPIRIVLVGIAINTMFTGLASAFGAVTGGAYTGAQEIVNANISLKTWSDVKIIGIYGIVGFILSVLVSKRCNLLSLSDETVGSLGVNVTRSRFLISCLSVMLASVFTSVIGPVSFLGLIVPHCARLLVGSDHRVLVPFSALLGAFVFLLADTVGRVIAYPYEISASILMAVVGGPVLIILLKRRRNGYGS